jgi:predicted metal-dependent hydrolase
MLRYPEPYIEYLVYFHTDRDLFECHEVLETYWKSVPESPFRQAWLGLIQTAVGLYHHRRGNLIGARKMLDSALSNLSETHLKELGIDPQKFVELVKSRLIQLTEDPIQKYADLNLPLSDPELLQLCMSYAVSVNKNWLDLSDTANSNLIHKHTLRDRTEVVKERQKQLVLKQVSQEGMKPDDENINRRR